MISVQNVMFKSTSAALRQYLYGSSTGIAQLAITEHCKMDESELQPISIPIHKHWNIKLQDFNVNKLFSFKTNIYII
jgi:hypothetical protein